MNEDATTPDPDAPISWEAIMRYREAKRPLVTMQGGVIVYKEQRLALTHSVHLICLYACRLFAWGGDFLEKFKEYIELETNDPAVLKNIGLNFSVLEGYLSRSEAPLPPNITNGYVINVFASLYHAVKPTTDFGKAIRLLIEDSFKVLELGPIPEAKFLTKLAEAKLERRRGR